MFVVLCCFFRDPRKSMRPWIPCWIHGFCGSHGFHGSMESTDCMESIDIMQSININWALFSEPGFLWIFRFPYVRCSRFLFFCCKIWLENRLVRYQGINNKGVLDRPWTIWKVLRAISCTLKCQLTGNHEFEKIWLFGETENWRPGVYFDPQCVSAHFCLAKTPSIDYGVTKIQLFMSP